MAGNYVEAQMVGLGIAFSDTISGYISSVDSDRNGFQIKTSDGRGYPVRLGAAAYAEITRNLGESYVDCTSQMRDMLMPGRFLYVYGVFYPDTANGLEAEHLLFVGRGSTEFVFEKPDWWVKQIQELGNFYYRAQFGDGPVDFRNYRTMLDLYGRRIESTRQETDTISRLIYGFASAYLLTGDERFLEAAEKGSDYLRDHFCAVDTVEDTCYWYHAVDFAETKGRKILGSKMPDVPACGVPVRPAPASERCCHRSSATTLTPSLRTSRFMRSPARRRRIASPAILESGRTSIARSTCSPSTIGTTKAAVTSHTSIPSRSIPGLNRSDANRARKNWNSVGDHAPAYLINLLLATGEQEHAEMLIDTAATITARFPDYDNSAFVQEKFHEDWSPDREWGWQQNRAVVGHNLKIAWNVMRVHHLKEDPRYVQLAEKIAELMPKHGGDPQRGGWYDVVERSLQPGQTVHRFAFHDRKAWWQQEQGILAYLILAGSLKRPEYLKHARESAAFYNAFFLDHDSGAVYFNVLANGMPYLLGTERNKGSHSMSGYHSFELCYLAATYTNLLITKQPLDLYFKPKPGGFKDGVLRVAPDLLPKGSIRIESVTVDGEDYGDFDADALTVTVPAKKQPVKIKVRIVPTRGLDHFSARLSVSRGVATLILAGDLDQVALPFFMKKLDEVVQAQPTRVILKMSDLQRINSAAVRALIFAKQKMRTDEDVQISGASREVRDVLNKTEFAESVDFVD